MASVTNSNPSLWWKLSWQLSLVFVAVVAAVIVGLCVYGAMILSPTVGLQDKLTVALNEALKRDKQGRLSIVESPALRAFKSENDRLWFVVATRDGMMTSYGVVPAPYAEMSRYVRLMKDADIRGATDIDEVASIDSIGTPLGEVRVMYGGNTSRSATFLTMLTKTYPIYFPLLVMTLPAVFLTVPRIVRHALAGLNSVVRKAPDIDPRRAGSRLPVEDVPKEVVPLIVAFNSILERLEEQFQARQRFLIDAAHELRTPIAIMQTRIEGISDGQERRRLMDDVARLGATAEQLLDFERNDQVNDLHETVDLVDIARTVVADLAPLAIAAGYEISFESEVDKFERKGSPSALPRAISNLVRNAIDHGGNSGMISVSITAEGQVVVADQGKGIPADQQELVFEPFYRVTPRSKGAGLGLSLVKQIVANHRGRVTIDSDAGGTTLTIQL
ncbi:HAMP domain-containing sensor histidine kinase [Mesorhizobium sp. YR577]|uniref:sensor histidine kinase n=1 Tax=Mesorhizobium sp. YR577 TaxID=1884373 RepID=UPI0008F12016|nr:HAMP domain-containing sensor histidine kinase [Mesorhizobium sp. YR577]SFU17133.1 Signal transduction histidine kinase [Mesorhizobium sp. YR577]